MYAFQIFQYKSESLVAFLNTPIFSKKMINSRFRTLRGICTSNTKVHLRGRLWIGFTWLWILSGGELLCEHSQHLTCYINRLEF